MAGLDVTKYTLEELKEEKRKIMVGFDVESPEECLEAVKQNGLALCYVKEQTPEICLVAVKENGYSLQYVKDQTEEICLVAVKRNGYSLKYVKEQTEEICLAAVKQNGIALQYVKEQTEEICLAAVKQNGIALQYVKEQTEEICMLAVHQDGLVLQYVKDQTEEICLEAVKQDGIVLQYVKDQTEEICLEAVKQDGISLRYVKEQTEEICMVALKQNRHALVFVQDLTMLIPVEEKKEMVIESDVKILQAPDSQISKGEPREKLKVRILTDGVYPDDQIEKINGSKSDWIDLRASKDIIINEGESRMIPLGIAMEIPQGYEALLLPRSSTFKTWGIIMTNSMGVIDESYCGNDDQWHFPAYCLEARESSRVVGKKPVLSIIHKGDRICQFRLIKHQPNLDIEYVDELTGKNRGGFGSTGQN